MSARPNPMTGPKLKWYVRASSGTDSMVEGGSVPLYGANGVIGTTDRATYLDSRVLVGRVGSAGKVVWAEPPFGATDNVLVMREDSRLSKRYLFYVLQSLNLEETTTKTAQPLVTASMIRSYRVHLPEALEDQARIASFLDRATARIDSLIAREYSLVALLQEKRRTLISHFITKGGDADAPKKRSGIPYFGDVPGHWEVKPLKRVLVLQRGYDLPSEKREAGTVPVVTSSGVDGTHSVAMATGPGVVTGRYGSVGRFYLIEEDYWPHNTALFTSELRGIEARYAWYLLQHLRPQFLLESAKSAVPGVDRNDVHALRVAVPRSLAEQQSIVRRLDEQTLAIDELVSKLENAIRLSIERKMALVFDVISGQIDVGDLAPDGRPTLETIMGD